MDMGLLKIKIPTSTPPPSPSLYISCSWLTCLEAAYTHVAKIARFMHPCHGTCYMLNNIAGLTLPLFPSLLNWKKQSPNVLKSNTPCKLATPYGWGMLRFLFEFSQVQSIHKSYRSMLG